MRLVLLLSLLLAAGAACAPRNDCHDFDLSCDPLTPLLYQFPINFVASGDQCAVWSSVDGVSWSLSTLPDCIVAAGGARAVAYGAGQWIAVGTNNGVDCAIWRSQDRSELSWSRVSCPASFFLSSIAFSTGGPTAEFSAGGQGNGGNIMAVSSEDGLQWINRTYADVGAGAFVRGTVYQRSQNAFYHATPNTQGVRRRPVLGTWSGTLQATGVVPGGLALGKALPSGSRRTVIIHSGAASAQYNDDDWATTPNTLTPNLFGGVGAGINGLAYGNGRFVFVRNGCGVTYSDDGLAADASGVYTMPSTVCSAVNLGSVAFAPSRFVIGGEAGKFYYSLSGLPSDWRQATAPTTAANPLAIGSRFANAF